MSVNVLSYPDPILLRPSEPTTFEEGVEIGEQLKEAMRTRTWGNAVGFAAPQIGINKRVILVGGMLCINPEIVWRGQRKMLQLEGCYSLTPNRHDYKVWRNVSVAMSWIDKDGESHKRRFSGKTAQIIQHEVDHLDGKLCCGEDSTR